MTADIPTRLDAWLSVAYAQWARQVDDRLSLAGQLRCQRHAADGTTALLGGGEAAVPPTGRSYWLPSLVAS